MRTIRASAESANKSATTVVGFLERVTTMQSDVTRVLAANAQSSLAIDATTEKTVTGARQFCDELGVLEMVLGSTDAAAKVLSSASGNLGASVQTLDQLVALLQGKVATPLPRSS